MQVKNIVICDEIINQPGPNGSVPCLMMPYTNINLPIVPTTFSFSIFVMINGTPEEPGEFKLEIAKETSLEKILNTVTIPVDSNSLDEMKKSEHPSISFAVSTRNLLIEEEGVYSIKIYYGKDEIGTQSIGFYKSESR